MAREYKQNLNNLNSIALCKHEQYTAPIEQKRNRTFPRRRKPTVATGRREGLLGIHVPRMSEVASGSKFFRFKQNVTLMDCMAVGGFLLLFGAAATLAIMIALA